MADRKKQRERQILEWCQSASQSFPQGPAEDHERPDFIVCADGRLVGVEVTELHQGPVGSGTFPKPARRTFEQRLVNQACAAYEGGGGAGVNVLVYFNEHVESNDLSAASDALAATVRSSFTGSAVTLGALHGLPAGISVVGIAPAGPDAAPHWRSLGSGHTEPLSRSVLEEAIDKKEALLPAYRAATSDVWLLIWTGFDFAFPAGSEQWRFRFTFDAVAVASLHTGRLEHLTPE